METYTGLNITSSILYYLSIWGLLFVVVYKLNNMIRKQLGAVGMIYKTVPLALLGIMAALFIAELALASYVSVGMNNDYYYYDNLASIAIVTYRLRLAIMVVYLVMVLISAVLAGMTISALRTRRLPGGVSTKSFLFPFNSLTDVVLGPHRLGSCPILFYGCLVCLYGGRLCSEHFGIRLRLHDVLRTFIRPDLLPSSQLPRPAGHC